MGFRILCFLLMTIKLGYSEQCRVNYADNKCQYNMVCVDAIDEQQMLHSFHHDRYRSSSYQKDSEACSQTIAYGGYMLDPVYLIFRYTLKDPLKSLPLVYNNWNGQEILGAIYSLDLSEDNYDYTPVIKSMQNLAILDMSKNQLTEAVLSNKFDLSTLKEIDLSYNTISDIQVKMFEHPYSSLKKINMSHNYLVKIPDAVFDKFNDLETLDLSDNYIEGLSQFTFEGMRNLLHLNISNNRLTDINTSLFRFSALKVLSLSGNTIKDIKLNDFEKLNNLEILDLSSNSITTIDYNVFQNMFSLSSLDLSNNLLEVASKDTFSNLQSLKSIDFSRNKFKSLPKGLFKNKTISSFSITDNLLEGSLSRGMFEGVNVTQLDLSNQLLTTVEDYAFYALIRLEILLLNDNRIQILSNMCFKTLKNLQELDLSNNHVDSLDFNKEDLTNLRLLLLKNNRLIQIKYEYFHDLNSLEYLDLSENAISRLDPSSFKSLRNLTNLRISDNSLTGTLKTGTFGGLVSLPSLDISRNLLTIVQNASFNDMNELKDLNMSHSKIKELQFNAFVNTGYIERLDLSYNKLENFFVNMTDLVGLSTLLLNNNLIKTIASASLYGFPRLSKISLAFNAIENIHNESFSKLIDLRFLDLSYNEKLKFTAALLENTKNLDSLILSGIKTDLHFVPVEGNALSELVISNIGIQNITTLNLSAFTDVKTLVLSNNDISKLEIGAFSGIGALRNLDLSFNNISFIQPGVFKDNNLLFYLNISHNSLSVIGYGIFRGLIYLSTLDVSYNNIKDLQSERFYETKSLSHLVVDHNRIESVNADEFAGTSLSKLSIGDNPLPCHILVKLKKSVISFEITSIKKDEHSGENVDGVTCNKDQIFESKSTITNEVKEKNDLLVDIRNILYNISNINTTPVNSDTKFLQNITNKIELFNNINEQNLLNLANLTSKIIDLNNDTNMLIKTILKSLNDTSVVSTTTIPLLGVNNSVITTTTVPLFDRNDTSKVSNIPIGIPVHVNKSVDPIWYINKIKKELEKTIADEKLNVINELDNKFSLIHYQTESLPTNPSNERLVSTNEGTKTLFTETCVALILLILVCLVLYKFYKSRMFIRNRLSFSTRELPSAMDNSSL